MNQQSQHDPELPAYEPTYCDDPQSVQEAEYAFPYHYVAQSRPQFTQCFYDSWGIHYVSTIEFLLEKLSALSFCSSVDVGCGDGRMSRELALRFADKKVIGIDYSGHAIGLARAMNSDIARLRFEQLDIMAPHELPASDVAVLMEVFEHIPPGDAAEFIRGVRRLLLPGGTLLVTVPHVNHPLEPKHFRHFTAGSIREALAAEFDVVDVIPFERDGLARGILQFLLGNRLFILNHTRLRDWIYRYYKRRLFHVGSEATCRRLFVRAVAK